MALDKAHAMMLLKETSRRPFKGRIITMGRMNIYFSWDSLQERATEVGVDLIVPSRITFSQRPDHAEKGYISDDCLFRSLGFSDIKVLDFSDYEGADYIFDLNNSDLPEQLHETFDVVLDSGTSEHIFHIPNVLNNYYKMLRVGGRIFHGSPSSNHMDHGFYMFSPGLFWDFYEANRFEINTFQIFRLGESSHDDPWEIYNYQPGCLNRISSGGLDDRRYGIFYVATKTEESTGDVIPQQRFFVENAWKTKEIVGGQPVPVEDSESLPLWIRVPRYLIRRSPLLNRILPLRQKLPFVNSLLARLKPRRPKGLHLGIIDRY